MTNPVVSNNYTSNNPDYTVNTRTLADNSQVQQVQLDIGTGTSSSPVTESNPLPVDSTEINLLLQAIEAQNDTNASILSALKQIRKHLEPSATQDSVQRQRVVVESLTGINGSVGTGNIRDINALTQGVASPTLGIGTVQMVWEAPVDQRYRVADAARTMAYLQRQNITFS